MHGAVSHSLPGLGCCLGLGLGLSELGLTRGTTLNLRLTPSPQQGLCRIGLSSPRDSPPDCCRSKAGGWAGKQAGEGEWGVRFEREGWAVRARTGSSKDRLGPHLSPRSQPELRALRNDSPAGKILAGLGVLELWGGGGLAGAWLLPFWLFQIWCQSGGPI